MECIRILHMIGSLEIGGSQAMVMNIYRNIEREKIQFDFIVDSSNEQYFADEIKQLGGKIYSMPKFKGTNLLEIKKKWNRFFIEHPEYKILHSHVRSYASIYLPIAKKHGVKTIIHSHSTSNGCGMSALMKAVLQYPLRYQADYFFGCSKKSGEWLFGKKIVVSDKFFVIKNAINIELYKPDPEIRKQYRKQLNIEEKAKVFVHIGRLHEAKNHMFLLEVFSLIKKKYDDAILVLVGDGDLKNKIISKINELELNKSVYMLGARNDVPNILKCSDCFLFPSNWEGLPVTVIEAQAAGLPCLISDRVTREVAISDLVKYLSVDNGVNIWMNEVERTTMEKRDVSKDIIKAGFDIRMSAKWILDFYKDIWKK